MPYSNMTGPYEQGAYTGRMGMGYYPQEIYGTPQSAMFDRRRYTSPVPYIQEMSQYLPQWYELRRQYELEQQRQASEQEYLDEMRKQARQAKNIEYANLGITGTQTAFQVGIPQYTYKKGIRPAYSYLSGLGKTTKATPGVLPSTSPFMSRPGTSAMLTTQMPTDFSQFRPNIPTSAIPSSAYTPETGGMVPSTQMPINFSKLAPDRGLLGRGGFAGTGMSPLGFGTTALGGFGFGQQYGKKMFTGGGTTGDILGGTIAGGLGTAGMGGVGYGLGALGLGISTGGLGLIPILAGSILGGLGATSKRYDWGRKISEWWKNI